MAPYRLSRSTARRRDSSVQATTSDAFQTDPAASSTPRSMSGDPYQPLPSRGSLANIDGIGYNQFRTRDSLAFNGHRDYYEELGYPEILQYSDHYHLFRRGGIARRLVLAYPLAIWESGVNLIEDEDPNISTPFEIAIEELETRLHWRATFQKADILARIGRYSCILIGVRSRAKSKIIDTVTRDSKSGMTVISGELATPLPPVSGPEDVIYLKPLPEVSARISEYDIDPSSPRFGLPLFYYVSVNVNIFDLPTNGGLRDDSLNKVQKVHWSRMVHITRGSIESAVYGIPILEAVWNLFFDMLKNIGGGSEAYWRNMIPATVYDLDPEITFKSDGTKSAAEVEKAAKQDIHKQVTEISHGLRRTLLARGITATQLKATVDQFDRNAATIMDHICGTTGIPQRIAMGSERGNQASSQDEKNWNSRVNEERELQAVPNVADFVGRLMSIGAIPFSDTYNASWPVSDDLTEVDKSESAFKMARANAFMKQSGGGIIQTSAEIRENLWEMGPLDPKDQYPVDPNAPVMATGTGDGKSGSPGTGADDNPLSIEGDRNMSNRFMSALTPDEPLPYPVSSDCRIVILGGPRSGKSSLAARYQAAGVPVYCGDARSMVKDIAEGITYAPENLSWSDNSQYIADTWLSSPGPWVCEGVSMVRALRKLMHGNPEVAASLQVIYLRGYQIEPTPGQVTMSKGIATVWNEMSSHFADHIVIDTGNVQVGMSAHVQPNPLKTKSERKCGTKRVLSVRVESRNHLVFERI